jgi:hypothetical protein
VVAHQCEHVEKGQNLTCSPPTQESHAFPMNEDFRFAKLSVCPLTYGVSTVFTAWEIADCWTFAANPISEDFLEPLMDILFQHLFGRTSGRVEFIDLIAKSF